MIRGWCEAPASRSWAGGGDVDVEIVSGSSVVARGRGRIEAGREAESAAGSEAQREAGAAAEKAGASFRSGAFVERVDFVTSVGHGIGPGDRARLGLRGAGPVRVITDIGVLEPHPQTAELVLTALHPGGTVERAIAETGWNLQTAADVVITAAPTTVELSMLRGLRTVGS